MLNPRHLLATAAITATAVVTLGTGTTSAQAPEGDDLRPRLERVCLRIPNMQIRTDNVLARISGDASTRGSLAWLDVKISEAEANERPQLAEVLTNRRAVREAAVPVLEARRDALAGLAEQCASYGVDV
jgi:hypothetical protein